MGDGEPEVCEADMGAVCGFVACEVGFGEDGVGGGIVLGDDVAGEEEDEDVGCWVGCGVLGGVWAAFAAD